MAKPTENKEKKGGNIVSGAAGAGGGTLLVLLAQNMGDTNEFKSWLLILAPSASVLLGGLLSWVKDRLIDFFRERTIEKAFEKAKITLETALTNEKTSEEHKKSLREKLEDLERLAVKGEIERIQTLLKQSS